MLYAVDDDQSLGFFDLADDAIHATASRPEASEFALQCTADAVRVVEQCAEHEFDDCSCDTFSKAIELSCGGTGNAQCVDRCPGAHLVRYRLRSSSPVTKSPPAYA